MLQTIKGRLALDFTLLVAGSLIVMLSLTGWLAYHLIDELRPRIRSAIQETQTLNEKNLLLNSAGYLSERLYPHLKTPNLTALNQEIDQINGWLPIQTFLVADLDKRIVTDGSLANPRRGQPVEIPAELLPEQPIIRTMAGGSELFFVIGINDQITGYALVTLSNAALQTSLRMLDDQVGGLWGDANRSLVIGAGFSLLGIGALAGFLIWRLSRSVSRPITEMIRAAEAYASGNLDIALPVRSGDELGHLALALNTMAKELKVSHRRMRHLANYDTLTSLPNRHLFHDRLRHALHAADRGGHQLALLFLDLDGFKAINDSLGHGLGDEVLKLVATRLRDCVRASDTIARLGGDEFTVIAERLHDARDVETLATKLLTCLRQPYPVQGHTLSLSASIGITRYPQDGTAPETLLRNADGAMYLAKRQGKNTYRFFTEELDEHASGRRGLEQSLRQAIEQQEFELHYQPQIDSASGELIGVETLLRWRNPREVIQPAEFIPLLEDTGLITRLTAWILSESCRTLAQWREERLPALRIAINLSAHQLEQPDLVPTIRQILQDNSLAPDALEIEITEGTMLNAEHSQEVAEQLQHLGVRLVIDDFGTGYSSLVSLQRFSVVRLKIDRSFVREVVSDRESTLITSAMIALARQLEIETLAEGVETRDQWLALQEQGCDMIQGYLISEPLPADQFWGWAAKHPGVVVKQALVNRLAG
jgi:diguanylate cyclase (GGDEF)-like protein